MQGTGAAEGFFGFISSLFSNALLVLDLILLRKQFEILFTVFVMTNHIVYAGNTVDTNEM